MRDAVSFNYNDDDARSREAAVINLRNNNVAFEQYGNLIREFIRCISRDETWIQEQHEW